MQDKDVIRAWKDEDYRESLSGETLAALPAHPAGLVELSDEQLTGAAGGTLTPTPLCVTVTTWILSCWGNCDCGCGS